MTTKTEGEDINTGDDVTTVSDDDAFEAAFGEFADPVAASDDDDIDAGDDDDAAPAGAASDDLGEDDDADPEPDADPSNSGDDDGNGDPGGKDDGSDPSDQDGSDIWANAPPELRSAHEAERKKSEQALKSQTGRISAYQRQVNELHAQINAASRKGTAANQKDKAASGDAAPDQLGDADGFKTLREDYPEIAQPIENMFNRMQADISRRDQTIENLMNKDRQVHIDEQEAALLEAHPDWMDVTQSEAFRNWVTSAPAHIQPILEQNANDIVDAASAADAIELFKLRTGYKPSQTSDPVPQPKPAGAPRNSGKRSRQLESGTSAKSGRGVGGSGGPAKDNYEAAFDYYVSKA